MTVHFYADAEGVPPLSWQWQKSSDGFLWENITDGSDGSGSYEGTDGSALGVSFEGTSLDGTWYRAQVSNQCAELTTGSALLTITNGTAEE